jgi:putative ATPase
VKGSTSKPIEHIILLLGEYRDQNTLFDRSEKVDRDSASPLAVRMRPRTLKEFIGQRHFFGPDKLLTHMLEADRLDAGRMRTVLFTDEIHRFNRAQPDVLLDDVESGVLILMVANTENRFFPSTYR